MCKRNNQYRFMYIIFAEIACPELQPPINGALVHDTVLTRPFRTMLCNDQFDIPDMGNSFNGQFFCTDDGDWTPFSLVPDCIGMVYQDYKVPLTPRLKKVMITLCFYRLTLG
jgi:hypothetical protein